MTKLIETRLDRAKKLAKEKAEKLAEDVETAKYKKNRTNEKILIHNEAIKCAKDEDYQSDTTYIDNTGHRAVIVKNIWTGIDGETYIASGGLNPFLKGDSFSLVIQSEMAKSNPKLMRYCKNLVTPKTWKEQIKIIEKGKK